MRGSVQNAIELAAAYAEAGLFEDADSVLGEWLASRSATSPGPMLHYLREAPSAGPSATKPGPPPTSATARPRPSPVPTPTASSRESALEAAIAAAPGDATAQHPLGRLLYGLGQMQEGLRQWQEAARLNEGLALAWRNVGYAESQRHDDRSALAAYDRAFAIDPTDARVLLERDQVAQRLRLAAAERRALLEGHRPTVEGRDDLVSRYVDLLLDTASGGDLDEAERILTTKATSTSPGNRALIGLHHAWVEVQQRLGERALARGDRPRALRHYQRAFEYPRRLRDRRRTPISAPTCSGRSRSRKAPEAATRRVLDERYPAAVSRQLLPGARAKGSGRAGRGERPPGRPRAGRARRLRGRREPPQPRGGLLPRVTRPKGEGRRSRSQRRAREGTRAGPPPRPPRAHPRRSWWANS